jgi:2-polyprenyl-3-methyl-5-hydroxy-6-metoxy-1,4-benzoquinol methylase
MILTTMTPEMGALKTRLKKTWESGDYGVFAKYLQTGALEFFDRLNIPPGTRLLDVACGAGQLTLPAAHRGIRVTGLDLAANLVRQARKKGRRGAHVCMTKGTRAVAAEDWSFDG